ncbi:MAG: hypothetical protein QNJ98_13440 [Planctomycetota bacterium]|nr:hypothetical protein [Planctomycetota bacterium]
METEHPVDAVEARFVDDLVAREVADALNRWFGWVIGGGEEEIPPPAFEGFGVTTADYAWRVGEDVDWEIGPHARAVGTEVRIAIQTHDTWAALSGLLRRLGALSVRVHREEV